MISDIRYMIIYIWWFISDKYFSFCLRINSRKVSLIKNFFFCKKNFQHAHRAIGKWYWFLTKSFCSARITIWETPPLSLCVCNKASRDSYVGRTVRWLVCQFGHKFKKSLETLVGQLYRLWRGVSTEAENKTTLQSSVYSKYVHSCPAVPEEAPWPVSPYNNTDCMKWFLNQINRFVHQNFPASRFMCFFCFCFFGGGSKLASVHCIWRGIAFAVASKFLQHWKASLLKGLKLIQMIQNAWYLRNKCLIKA